MNEEDYVQRENARCGLLSINPATQETRWYGLSYTHGDYDAEDILRLGSEAEERGCRTQYLILWTDDLTLSVHERADFISQAFTDIDADEPSRGRSCE